MRTQNHSDPATLNRDSRLIDSALCSRKYKRPNAQKCGLYARPAFIPGEDPHDYDQIRSELIEYWKPAGPDLRDALRELAEIKFLKRRLKRYIQTQLQLCTFNPRHPAFDEAWGFTLFIHYLRTEPETCFREHAKKCLRRDKIDDLEQRFPREDYQATAEWAQAIITEMLSSFLPAKPGFDDVPELGYRAEELEQVTRQWRTDCEVAASITYARELLEYEAKETERLNDCEANKVLC